MGETPRRLKTWGDNKSVRLAGFDYAAHAPYNIVIRASPGSMPFANAQIAQMACQELRTLVAEVAAYLAACCLMPDHIHILMSPDRSGLSAGQIVGRYKGPTTNRSWSLGWTGRLWQNRFYDHIVRKNEDIAEVARYIYENPDRSGFPDDYPYRWVDPELG